MLTRVKEIRNFPGDRRPDQQGAYVGGETWSARLCLAAGGDPEDDARKKGDASDDEERTAKVRVTYTRQKEIENSGDGRIFLFHGGPPFKVVTTAKPLSIFLNELLEGLQVGVLQLEELDPHPNALEGVYDHAPGLDRVAGGKVEADDDLGAGVEGVAIRSFSPTINSMGLFPICEIAGITSSNWAGIRLPVRHL